MKVKITTTNSQLITYGLSAPLTTAEIPNQTIVTILLKLNSCFYPFTDIDLEYIGDYETDIECKTYITKFIYRKLSPILNYLKHIEGGNKSVLENAESTKTFERDQTVQKDVTKDLAYSKDGTYIKDDDVTTSENSENNAISEQSPITDIIGEIDTPNFKSKIGMTKSGNQERDVTDTTDEEETETGTISDDTIISDDYTDITTNFDTEYQIKARRYLLSDDVNRIFENIVKSTIQEYNNIF